MVAEQLPLNLLDGLATSFCGLTFPHFLAGLTRQTSRLTDSVWLYHPAREFLHKHLILYPSDRVVSMDASSDEFRFDRDDEE